MVLLSKLNVSKTIANHLIGEHHTSRHRVVIGLVIMVIGVSIYELSNIYHMLSLPIHLVSNAIDGIGVIPIVEHISKKSDMIKKKIGTVVMVYDEQGNPMTGSSFVPSITLNEGSTTELTNIKGATAEDIKVNADLVMANWFNSISNIELADREEWQIVSEIARCEKYPSGSPYLCIIDYHQQKD